MPHRFLLSQMMEMRFTHVVNPFEAPTDSDVWRMQQQTLQSMLRARSFGNADVDLMAAVFAAEKPDVPDGFNVLPLLERSVCDEPRFVSKKKLPFIADILQLALMHSEAPFIIYTNMDIVLQPFFYEAVAALFSADMDALVVNRRGIDTMYALSPLSIIHAAPGYPHPGFDCFVMKRGLVEKFVLGKISIGIPFLEVALLHNIIAFADNWRLVDELHLTTHIGREVMPPYDSDLYQRNRTEYETQIYPVLKPHLRIEQFPYAVLPFHKRMLKWMLNPSIRTSVVTEMEGKKFWRRCKFRLDEIRFRLLDRIR